MIKKLLHTVSKNLIKLNKSRLVHLLAGVMCFIAVWYLVFGAYLYFRQKDLIYFPSEQDFYSCAGFSGYTIESLETTRAYFLDQVPDKILVYYHGNAGSACDRALIARILEDTGFSLLFVEYAGYSNDTRKPSRDLILEDVQNVEGFLRRERFSEIVVYGQSLGTGPASYHTTIGQVNKLILVSAFDTIANVASDMYPIYPVGHLITESYSNDHWLAKYTGEMLFLHGDRDSVIPAKSSKRLFDSLPINNKEYIIVSGADHNNLWKYREFRKPLLDFITSD